MQFSQFSGRTLHRVRAQPPHSSLAWHTSHSVLEWTQYIDASRRFMAIFVPRLILNDKQFVEKSFIHSKSTSACCCFFTLRGQGFRNWFQIPKLLPAKCWYSRRKGHGHKRYLCLQEFKISSHIPLLLYFLPPRFTLDWATSFWP